MKLEAGLFLLAAMLAGTLTSADAQTQTTAKSARVGIMVNGSARSFLDRFRDDFAKQGYVGDNSVMIDGKFAEGQIERHTSLAKELVADGADVILALGGPAARAAKNATQKIPVVFAIVTDPVALGLVASRERPGGNVTGITSLDPQQAGSQFRLLKEALPAIKRVAILSDDTIPGADVRGLAPIDRANEAAALAVGLEPLLLKLKGGPSPDLEGAFAQMLKEQVGAVLVLETPVPFAHQKRIGELAIAHRLPAMFPGGQADAAGLFAYGTSVTDAWPRMVAQADKILKGANPAEMPVEAITRLDLVLNLGTARKIGITVPADIVKRADRTIE